MQACWLWPTGLMMSLFGILALLGGCSGPVNPSFSVSMQEAQQDMRRMKQHPIVLERPVVVLSGYNEPGVGGFLVSEQLKKLTGDERVMTVSFPVWLDMNECRQHMTREIVKRFGENKSPQNNSPRKPIEIDVVGFSMGGVVGRYAGSFIGDDVWVDGQQIQRGKSKQQSEDINATDGKDGTDGIVQGRQIQIVHLYTIASPHLGADLARLPALTKQHEALRQDSNWITCLNQPGMDGSNRLYTELDENTLRSNLLYTLVPYTRLEDEIVGEQNSAPPGMTPWWVSRPWYDSGHVGAMLDQRILADIARRLRGEKPWTMGLPAQLPD